MSRKRIGKNVAYDTEKKLYYAYFDGGRGKNGQRERWTRTFRSEREAVQAVETFAAERREGGLPAAEAITVGAWLDYWLEEIVRPNLEYTTYYCYANIIRNHLKPSLGRVLLRELTPLRIQQYYTQMIKGKGLSPNTVHKHHILLHTALKLAFRQEILGSNPVDRVEPPRARAARQLYYTPQELKLLFQAAEGGRMELIVKLAGYLGLRRGEICGLRWENIDFRKKVLSVRLARTTAGGTVVEKPPKTPNSLRSLGFAGLEDLERLLRRTREEQRAAVCAGLAEDTGFVLADRRGRPWNPNQVTRAMEAFVEVNGLPPITLHGLRHTFASVANSAHIPLPDISRALGHKDVVVTGRVYTHIFDQIHVEAVSAVARSIRGA